MTSHIFKKIIFFSAVIILWQAVASFDLWPDQIFPSPYEIAEDLAYGVLDGSLFYGIGTSMIRLIVTNHASTNSIKETAIKYAIR